MLNIATSGRSWETAETKLLMDLRRDMDHEFSVVKRNAILWKKLSERLNGAGYSRTDKQCKEKWKNLLSEYKRAESQKGLCEGEQQRIFPYYDHIKDILVKQPGLTLSSILDSPPPNSDNKPNNSPYHPAYNRSDQLSHPLSYSGQPSTSQYTYHNEPIPAGATPNFYHERSNTPSLSPYSRYSSRTWQTSRSTGAANKKSDNEEDDKIHTNDASILFQVLELMRQEISERRRWEERIEARQLESKRREEARERRKERRERERAQRQKYYTQILVTLASHIAPHAAEFLPCVSNRNEGSGSDSEKNIYTAGT